jgi:lycopene beta-cyclase
MPRAVSSSALTRSTAVQFWGAGLAGLTLALTLRQHDTGLPIAMVDPQGKALRSQSFGYFRTHPHAFEALHIASFDHARICTKEKTVAVELHQFPYQIIPAAELQNHVYGLLNCEISTQVDELNIAASENKRIVFDSRPLPLDQAPMQQVFFGGEFDLTHAIDCSVVTLMDFRIDACGHIRFVYVVPLSTTRALIQDTWLIANGAEFDAAHFRQMHAQTIDQHLRQHYQTGVSQCLREEHGVIAMGHRPQRWHANEQQLIVPIGARAGWLRASTGYSFGETQRAAQQLADWFFAGDQSTPPTYQRPKPSDWMDKVLLRALRQFPDQAPSWFAAMFKRTPTPALVRFLTGSARPLDHWHVMRALPIAPFLRAALLQ